MNLSDTKVNDETVSIENEKIKEPSMYMVLLHNDDYTSMEFVVTILETIFNKSTEAATIIMLKVHREGMGICGVYIREIAAIKIKKVQSLAKDMGFPLKCTMEIA